MLEDAALWERFTRKLNKTLNHIIFDHFCISRLHDALRLWIRSGRPTQRRRSEYSSVWPWDVASAASVTLQEQLLYVGSELLTKIFDIKVKEVGVRRLFHIL